MEQTKVESLIESSVNTFSGFIVSLVVWQFIAAPLFGLPVTIQSNLGITAIFTITSIIRSYYWRRFFAKGVHKKVKQLVQKFFGGS